MATQGLATDRGGATPILIDKRCNKCDEPIRWAKSKNGKNMPMDSRPDHRGAFLLLQIGTVWHAVHSASATEEEKQRHGPDRYSVHYDTCLGRPAGIP